MKGIVTIKHFKRGALLWERTRENLVVTAALAPIAKLISGTTAGQYVTVVGFGSATGVVPAVGDTAITPPAYYKATASVSVSGSSAQFSWTLIGSVDTLAVGMTVSELGFYCNPGGIGIPVYSGSGTQPAFVMYAHLAWPSFTVSGGGTYNGTWTFIA